MDVTKRWYHLRARFLVVLVLFFVLTFWWVAIRPSTGVELVAQLGEAGAFLHDDVDSLPFGLRCAGGLVTDNVDQLVFEAYGDGYRTFPAELLEGVGALRKVTTLSCTGMELTDKHFVQFGEVHTISDLYLRGSKLDGRSLRHLHTSPIRFATIRETIIGDEGAEQLGEFASLESLILVDTDVHGPGLKALSQCEELRSLIISGTEFTDDGLRYVVDIPALRRLGLSGTGVRGLGPKTLSSDLSELYLVGCPLEQDALAGIAGMVNLKTLNLARTPLRDEALAPLRTLSGLYVLNLSQTEITDAGLAVLLELPNLVELYLRGTSIEGSGLAVLKGQMLLTLDLSETLVDDSSLRYVTDIDAIASLNLDGCPVSTEGLRALLDWGGFLYLSFGEELYTPESLAEYLSTLRQ